MIKLANRLVCFLIGVLGTYLFWSFISWDLNPDEWWINQRTMISTHYSLTSTGDTIRATQKDIVVDYISLRISITILFVAAMLADPFYKPFKKSIKYS